MARTLWGIVYGTANPHDRQHILPDDDSELASYPVGPGEKLITIPIVPGEDNPTFTARMNAAICADAGVPHLMDCRFAEVDSKGNVVMIHRGDAGLHSGPNTYVNCHPNVAIGHTYAAGVFAAPSVMLQPKIGVRAIATLQTAATIPAGLSTTPIYIAP